MSAPSMRAGEGQADILSGFNQSMASLGSSQNPAGNVAMSSFLNKNGNPQSEEALRRAFGMSGADRKKDWDQLVSTPTGQRALSNYLGAAKAGNGPVAFQALGGLISGHPELEDQILKGGGFNVPDYMKDTVRQNVFGGSYLNQTAYGSTLSSQGASLGGMSPQVPTELLPKIKAAADKYGIPADALMATIAKESSFKNTAPWAGHNAAGLGQIMPGTAQSMGYSPDDRMDPDKNIDMTARCYAEQCKRRRMGMQMRPTRDTTMDRTVAYSTKKTTQRLKQGVSNTATPLTRPTPRDALQRDRPQVYQRAATPTRI